MDTVSTDWVDRFPRLHLMLGLDPWLECRVWFGNQQAKTKSKKTKRLRRGLSETACTWSTSMCNTKMISALKIRAPLQRHSGERGGASTFHPNDMPEQNYIPISMPPRLRFTSKGHTSCYQTDLPLVVDTKSGGLIFVCSGCDHNPSTTSEFDLCAHACICRATAMYTFLHL